MEAFINKRAKDPRFASRPVKIARTTEVNNWYSSSASPKEHLQFKPSSNTPGIYSVKSNASGTCWKGYERTPGTEKYAEGSCRKKGSSTGSKKTRKRRKKKSGSGSESYSSSSSESDNEGGRRKKKKKSDE